MLLSMQNEILRMVAQGDDLHDTLSVLCRLVESLLPGARASILTLSSRGLLSTAASGSLPASYAESLGEFAPGPNVGSCGSAAFHEKTIIVDDIEVDGRWADFKHLVLPLGLRACFSSPIFSSKGTVLGTFALYFDEKRAPSLVERSVVEGCLPLCMIALERHERVAERERLAYTDALTQLANREKFNRVIARPGRSRWALLLVDVDDLKSVNDTFGHAAGDDLISAVGSRVASVVHPAMVYRIGGDEFAIILDDATDAEAMNLANLIATGVRRALRCNGHTVYPTVTIGIAQTDSATSPKDMRQNADNALYHGKDHRRGSWVLFDDALSTSISKRNDAIQLVSEALATNRVEAWYQPIVRLETNEFIGVEALARIRQTDGTVISAKDFHEATKDAMVATALTNRMIERIADDLRSWSARNVAVEHVGINISAADLASDDFMDGLVTAMNGVDMPLDHVILEVTESVYLGDRHGGIANRMSVLRSAGFRLALDDFGTGFASLTHLMSVPVDVLKIDRSFIANLGSDRASTGIIEGILHIAKRMGITVVGEGIEQERQSRLLLTRGCTFGQGYLFSTARPACDIAHLLSSVVENRTERGRQNRQEKVA